MLLYYANNTKGKELFKMPLCFTGSGGMSYSSAFYNIHARGEKCPPGPCQCYRPFKSATVSPVNKKISNKKFARSARDFL